MTIEEKKLEQTLHDLIPLSRAMGLEVAELAPEHLSLRAPLALNHNHAGTAFAGSIYSVASLAGWAILRSLVERESLQAELVLGEAKIRYMRPLQGELSARVHLSTDEQERIVETLRAGRSARLRLTIELPSTEAPAAHFHGTYFARPTAAPGDAAAMPPQ